MTRGQTMSAVAVMAVVGAVTWGFVTRGGPTLRTLRQFSGPIQRPLGPAAIRSLLVAPVRGSLLCVRCGDARRAQPSGLSLIRIFCSASVSGWSSASPAGMWFLLSRYATMST